MKWPPQEQYWSETTTMQFNYDVCYTHYKHGVDSHKVVQCQDMKRNNIDTNRRQHTNSKKVKIPDAIHIHNEIDCSFQVFRYLYGDIKRSRICKGEAKICEASTN